MSEVVDDLKNELAQIKEDVEIATQGEEGEEEFDDSELIDDVMDLKRRVNGIEKELKEVTGVLKKTIMDVRTLISEMDNPFNFLRSIGVDKLVEKAMETAEEEIQKAKKESMKERMKKALSGEEEKKPIVTPVLPANVNVEANTRPQPQQPAVTQYTTPQSPPQQPVMPAYNVAMNGNGVQAKGLPAQNMPLPSLRSLGIPFMSPNKPSRRGSGSQLPLPQTKVPLERSYIDGALEGRMPLSRLFIVATYILLRFGEERADKILSQYVREGWVSREIANGILDIVRLLSEHSETLQLQSALNAKGGVDVEDHILVITLLNMLDDRDNSWLDLLLAITLLRIGLSPMTYKFARNSWEPRS